MEFSLHPLFLLLLLSLLSSSVSYNPPVKYFMNCGSGTDVDDLDGYPRTFVGDDNSNSSFSVGKSKSIQNENPLPGISLLYHTARIYTKLTPYMLDITQNGSYLVRLHFFPFSFKRTHLADALFDVSASNFSLLTDFRVPNSTTEFPVIKEFFLTIAAGKFKIYFKPAEETSYAFVNAIEAFLLPPNFFLDNASATPPLRTEDGLLRTLYRINVGGPEVNDTLWRNWVPDDDYLTFGGSGANRIFGGELHEASQGLIVQEIAPDSVYKTYKEASVDNKGASNFPNITWRFNVSKKARHLVRLHFCDFFSDSPGTVKFDLYISTNFSHEIDPNPNGVSEMASPFFYDFVVPSDDSGYMSFRIAPGNNSIKKVAFLNGLEIMEFVGNTTIVVPVDEHEPKKHLARTIGSAGGGTLVLVLILLFSLCLRLKRPKPVKAEFLYGKGRSPSWITEKTENASSNFTNLNLKLKMSLAEILAATHNFNPKLLIGEGGFGKVYKGTLETGMKVAVKRSDSSHGQGLPEFRTEVMVLSKIQHRHLVSLVGYCDEGSEMILVFEFLEKGTLRDHLYSTKECSKNPSAKTELNWKQRLEICIGSAKGLHYLHTGPDGGIFHRDVKSTNILLDEHYVAKVADFGLSQQGMPDPDHISMGFKGTFGYLDPEYLRTFQLTNKSDVYSFGVVLLEVLCARLPVVDSQQKEEINLAEWGMFWQKEGQLEKIIDPLLAGRINPNSLRKFGEIVEKCLKPQGADRPNMIDVCWDLEYAMQLQQTAVHREAHEDNTTTGVSSDSALPVMQNMSSNMFPIDDYSDTTAMYPN
ncbi:probable receptor-like protein kinase At5g24010 isoform X1 [Populus trichocarpa]|uniref:probable receptor-like protein kinase At5g24010 isoform X1 n=1 Tax=Populus trichocarpa TaxID=3694 RepID=UPI0022781830|nr:probable receptor-like protein kinase At5g24010 isoform X1 [Populus trichocarpa]